MRKINYNRSINYPKKDWLRREKSKEAMGKARFYLINSDNVRGGANTYNNIHENTIIKTVTDAPNFYRLYNNPTNFRFAVNKDSAYQSS